MKTARPCRFLALAFVSTSLTATPAEGQRSELSPVGNYHAHLVSEAAGRLLVAPPLPSIEVPQDLARVLREYEQFRKAGDAAALAGLYADDGLYPASRGWVRGREAIRAVFGSTGPGDFRLRAHAFAVQDSVASITGSVVGGGEPSAPLTANFMLALRRGEDGRWLIAALLRQDHPRLTPTSGAPFRAEQLIAQLDSARIQRALVLSAAYWFGSTHMPGFDRARSLTDEHARVQAENDWVAREVGRYPNRLIAFCSFNPLKAYALDEIDRCASHPGFKGIKLHLANSSVDLRNLGHVDQLRRVFRAANNHRLPVVVHMRSRLQPYGRQDAETFVRELLSAAPDIPIQIAHLVGWGSYDDAADEAAAVFAEAIARSDQRLAHVYFDLTSVVLASQPSELRKRIADRVRQLGVERMLYGSDLSDPRAGWADILTFLPLTESELTTIARNVAPYLR